MTEMTDGLRKLGAWLVDKDLDMSPDIPDGTVDPRDAADTIEALERRCAYLAGLSCAHESTIESRDRRVEALQHRCEELERANETLGAQLLETERCLTESDRTGKERIAALEAALRDIRSVADEAAGDTDPPGDPEDWRHEQPICWIAYRTNQALTSAGEDDNG